MDFGKVIDSINLTNPSWDLFVLVAFAVGICFYMFRGGKERAFVALVSSYIAFVIAGKLTVVEKALGFSIKDIASNKILVFVATTIVIFLIMSRRTSNFTPGRTSAKARFHAAVVGFLQIGLMISLIISFLPPQEARNLSLFLRYFFVQDGAQLFWLISPLVAIFLLREK